MASHRSPALFRRWRDLTWRGPSGPWLAALALVLVLGLTSLITAGILGLNQGLLDRITTRRSEIDQHLQKGLAHLETGRNELAAAEFAQVLQLDPGNSAALEHLQALQVTPTPTATPSPLLRPVLVAPPTVISPEDQARQALFEQAQSAVQGSEWTLADALLEELTNLDPTYRSAEVDALRFERYYRHGLELVGERRFEEALRAFDQALALRPDNGEAQAQRQRAAWYSDALSFWGVNWSQVIDGLQAIYEHQPGYADVTQRLMAAQEAWGDDLAETGRWCQAADHYGEALRVKSSAALQAKQRSASVACVQATPTPAEAAQDSATPQPASGGPYAGPANSAGHLAFASYSAETGRWTVYRVALRGQPQTAAVALDASQPGSAPSGLQLAVRSERGDQTGLAVLAVDGSERRRLTSFFEDGHPSWSPDGKQIAFDSNREGDRRWRIYRTWAGGGEEISMGYGRWPAWSPDGKFIAYQGCDERASRCGLWLIDADGANPRQLTDAPGDAMPAWSPDGARLAFAAPERSGTWDVHVLELATGRVWTLASGPAIDAHPTWSPDGRWVAFLSNREGPWAIYAVEVGSGQVSKVTNLPGDLPDWYETQITWGR